MSVRTSISLPSPQTDQELFLLPGYLGFLRLVWWVGFSFLSHGLGSSRFGSRSAFAFIVDQLGPSLLPNARALQEPYLILRNIWRFLDMVALDVSPALSLVSLSSQPVLLSHSIPDKEAAEGLEAAGRTPRAYRILGLCTGLGAQGLGVTE